VYLSPNPGLSVKSIEVMVVAFIHAARRQFFGIAIEVGLFGWCL